MERLNLNVQLRDKVGKGAARSFRRQGSIPAVIYGKEKSYPISLNKGELIQFFKKTSGEQAIVNLKFKDGDNRLALMKDYQVDPVLNEMLHVDFMEVSLTEKITVTVPLTAVGEPIGVKRDKGILQHITREVEIESLPDNIPGHMDIDISELEIGDSVNVSNLSPPEGVTILTDQSAVIISVIAPVVEEEVVPEEEEAEAMEEAEGPEVVKKGKKEEEEGKKEEEGKGKGKGEK
jgi:large subunit ribosomal protein L25